MAMLAPTVRQHFLQIVFFLTSAVSSFVLAAGLPTDFPPPEPPSLDLCGWLFAANPRNLSAADRYLVEETPKPKATIAADVEAAGFKTPRGFKTFANALNYYIQTRRGIILRSEHPIEYNGPSGIFESLVFEPSYLEKAEALKAENKLTSEKLIELRRPRTRIGWSQFWDDVPYLLGYYQAGQLSSADFEILLKRYAFARASLDLSKLGKTLDPEFFTTSFSDIYKKASFSYQAVEEGFNVSIALDSARTNTYHVFVNSNSGPGKYHNNGHYLMVDGEANILNHQKWSGGLPELLTSKLEEAIRFYDKIKALDSFDPAHAPLIEMSVSEAGPTFLQYHRIKTQRSMSPVELAKWRDEAQEGEVAVPFVQGATESSRGIIVDLQIVSYEQRSDFRIAHMPFVGGGIIGTWQDEFLMRRRSVHLILGDANNYLRDTTNGHGGRSEVLKPELTLILPHKAILTDDEIERLYDGQSIPVRLIIRSNGTNAFIRRVR